MDKKPNKTRLDLLLLDRRLVESRERARSLIMAGCVLANGEKMIKPGTSVPMDACLALTEQAPYVGRGGVKLAHALERFSIEPRDLTVLDVGASTGGFTDCLLQQGARRVYALDVGRGQLNYRLRQDSRVVVMEKVNAHRSFALPEKIALVTIDVSFISVTKVIPNLLVHMTRPGTMIVLVKPQFEAIRSEVGKGGIIKDTGVHARVLGRVILWATKAGLRLRHLTPSPILGTKGNREFFLFLEYTEYAISS